MNRSRLAVIVATGIVALWGVSGFVIVMTPLFPDWPTRGQFGDMFGAINALFSSLALAGVIYAIVLQRSELELQRQELALTRLELQRAADAQERSERALMGQTNVHLLVARLTALSTLLSHFDLERARKPEAEGLFSGSLFSGPTPSDFVHEIECLLEQLRKALSSSEQTTEHTE